MHPFPNPMCAGGISPIWAFDPTFTATGVVFSNQNRTATASANRTVRGDTGKTTGKWYAELTGTLTSPPGVMNNSAASNVILGTDANSWGYFSSGTVANNGLTVASGLLTYAANDTIGIAFDQSGPTVWFSVNGVWNGDPAAGTGGISVSSISPLYVGASVLSGEIVSIPQRLRAAVPSGFGVL